MNIKMNRKIMIGQIAGNGSEVVLAFEGSTALLTLEEARQLITNLKNLVRRLSRLSWKEEL
jgi:hypothetical protein